MWIAGPWPSLCACSPGSTVLNTWACLNVCSMLSIFGVWSFTSKSCQVRKCVFRRFREALRHTQECLETAKENLWLLPEPGSQLPAASCQAYSLTSGLGFLNLAISLRARDCLRDCEELNTNSGLVLGQLAGGSRASLRGECQQVGTNMPGPSVGKAWKIRVFRATLNHIPTATLIQFHKYF